MKLIKKYNYRSFVIHQYDVLESTNKLAYNLAENQQIFDHEIIVANSQTHGRGRLDRIWSSPIGNLYFSMILKPSIGLDKISQIIFVTNCALNIAIEKVFKLNSQKAEIKNKWPNDLLINNKKIAGILLESKNSQYNNQFVIVGIGININSNPENSLFPSTNLANFSVNISKTDLLNMFLDEFENLYQNWLKFGFTNLRKLWLKNSYNLNKNITIKPDGIRSISGIFKNIDDNGNIFIETQGKISEFSFGDIIQNSK